MPSIKCDKPICRGRNGVEAEEQNQDQAPTTKTRIGKVGLRRLLAKGARLSCQTVQESELRKGLRKKRPCARNIERSPNNIYYNLKPILVKKCVSTNSIQT